MKNSEYLFVYGTLMSKYGKNPFRSELAEFSSYYAEAKVKGKLYMIEDYPGLVPNEVGEDYFTFGEVFIINNTQSLFKVLDVYEDYYENFEKDSLYLRKKIEIFDLQNNPIGIAHTYFYNKPVELPNFIRNGCFLSKIS
jgi:gamma-glutamylcyclotransferase (GGCT)/AIG2-like uncharacterized protein YtfP